MWEMGRAMQQGLEDGMHLRHSRPRNTAAGVSADARSAAGNPYAPFASKIDWEIARWAKTRGLGSTAFSELLAIDGVRL